MPDRILVTGATGFIAGHLLRALSIGDAQIYLHSSRDGDIANCPLAFEDVTHVYHLAARSYVPDSWKSTREVYETNVLGTVNVLELCRRTGASLTLLSSYVYGPPRFLPVSEEHPLAAFNPYSHTKILAEEVCSYYGRQFGFRVTVVRPFNIYGPGQRDQFLIPMVIRQAVSDAPRIEVDDDRPRRDYLYIDDFIDVLLRVRGQEGVYNAGSGRSASVAEVVAAVNSLLPQPKPLLSRAVERPVEIMDVVADVSKARRELQWEPRTPLIEGLRATIAAHLHSTLARV